VKQILTEDQASEHFPGIKLLNDANSPYNSGSYNHLNLDLDIQT